MKICHFIGNSLIRHTPARIACMWGRYTEHEGTAFGISRSGGSMFHEPLTPYGYYLARKMPKSLIKKAVEEAAVLHFHDDGYPSILRRRYEMNLKGKKLIYQAHIGNIPERLFARRPAKFGGFDPEVYHTGITNGYGHLFDEDEKKSNGERSWGRLPDVLDLNHPAFHPEPNIRPPWNSDPLVIVFTYSNHHEKGGKINAKCPRGHKALLGNIPGVRFISVSGKPFEEAMALKKKAHVVIEECFSPYLHLSALEGVAIGACVVTCFNSATITELSRAVGAPENEWPFVFVKPKTLVARIIELRDNRELLKRKAEEGFNWAHKYYMPEQLLQRYLEAYEKARPATH